MTLLIILAIITYVSFNILMPIAGYELSTFITLGVLVYFIHSMTNTNNKEG